MFTRTKGERDTTRDRNRDRDREQDTGPFRRRKAARPPMLSLPRSNSVKILPSKSGRIEEETACGVMWSVVARRGRRRTHREDMYSALPFVSEIHELPVSIFAIFDGHGGQRAAQYASERLPNIFLEKLEARGAVRESLVQAFLATDEELVAEFLKRDDVAQQPRNASGSSLGAVSVQPGEGKASSVPKAPSRTSISDGLDKNLQRKNSSPHPQTPRERGLFDSLRRSKSRADEQISATPVRTGKGCGCTATVVTLVGNRCSIAHVGDSRAVLSTGSGVKRLCEDHRPGRPDEQRRIESSGGLVLEISGTHRVNGVLAVSRSIGDAELKDFVIAKPEIVEFEIGSQEEVLIVATDGLWDVVSDEESVHMVRELFNGGHGEEEAAKKLIERAWERGSNDDTCVMVINLVKYIGLCTREAGMEFMSPMEGGPANAVDVQLDKDVKKEKVIKSNISHGDAKLPVDMEMVTPHAADPAPTPRVRKQQLW